jgi:hypothetical protein
LTDFVAQGEQQIDLASNRWSLALELHGNNYFGAVGKGPDLFGSAAAEALGEAQGAQGLAGPVSFVGLEVGQALY